MVQNARERRGGFNRDKTGLPLRAAATLATAQLLGSLAGSFALCGFTHAPIREGR